MKPMDKILITLMIGLVCSFGVITYQGIVNTVSLTSRDKEIQLLKEMAEERGKEARMWKVETDETRMWKVEAGKWKEAALSWKGAAEMAKKFGEEEVREWKKNAAEWEKLAGDAQKAADKIIKSYNKKETDNVSHP